MVPKIIPLHMLRWKPPFWLTRDYSDVARKGYGHNDPAFHALCLLRELKHYPNCESGSAHLHPGLAPAISLAAKFLDASNTTSEAISRAEFYCASLQTDQH